MEQIAYSIDDAAKALSIGKTKLYSELSSGKIQGIKLGKRTLITRENINKYIADLELYPSENGGK